MDDVYALELLRQNLTDACAREDGLKSALQAAQNEMQELQKHTHEHKPKYQELDSLLEAEEAKTNAERLARQQAEETTRQHRAEVLKLRRNEATANRHCETAESEIINLQRDLSTERSATVAAGLLCNRLREDLRQAEANGIAAYDMLNAARAKICALEQDLRVATNRINILELQARESKRVVEKEHQRVAEAEKSLSATTSEITSTELKFHDLLDKYNALEAEHSKCHIPDYVPSTVLTTTREADETRSPISPQNSDPPSSNPAHDQVRSITKDNEETLIINATPRTTQDPVLNPPEMPSPPEPAILRPRLPSVTSCQVDIFKATGRIVPVPTAANTRNLRWKFFWRLPGDLLRILIRDAGRR